MSRYIQQDNKTKPQKEEKPRELKKPGQYTSEELMNSKKVISPNGGR